MYRGVMKKKIHPKIVAVTVTCTCGNQFVVNTALKKDKLALDICSKCHPFYTGKQKLVDTAGMVDNYRRRFFGGNS